MDFMQQTTHYGTDDGQCHLKLVNLESDFNHTAHETQGLSKKHLVVRRGKPFKVTLLFSRSAWNPRRESLVLETCLGNMSKRMPVHFSDNPSNSQDWSATVYPECIHPHSVTVYICSPVQSSVALYNLLLHIETMRTRRSYHVGSFVLLCNPWLHDDPVYMPLDAQIQEYVKSDYGLLYMGTNVNIASRPWSFGQYEPGVLEACLMLLNVSPQHLKNQSRDFILREDPVYISRVICAMVNCNDDLGILEGKWQGDYQGGVRPTEWSSSADILRHWVSSNCKPVRYGQCWVFASVLCTVMRVLGIPSRVVTVFNAAHDGDGSVKIEEYYSSTGEKLNLSKDSIWNFHVWVECWMRRPDLGSGFDGWQVVDPTPQEKSEGIYCCGPCPVAAIQHGRFGTPYDMAFIYASVDADVIRLILRNGLVVGRTVDKECVGQLIYTKSIGSDQPENLTLNYKCKENPREGIQMGNISRYSAFTAMPSMCAMQSSPVAGRALACRRAAGTAEEVSPGLEVSLSIHGAPKMGESIVMSVVVTNQTGIPKNLLEHLSAQLKDYDKNPQESFWKSHKELHIQPGQVLKLHHTIPASEYQSVLTDKDIVNLAVVIKDIRTKERFMDMQEFNLSSPEITIEVEGGDSIQIKTEHTARVSFINTFTKTLHQAVLTVTGSGLLKGKQEARASVLEPGEKMEKSVSIMAATPGTKVLMATFSHRDSPSVVSRNFHKVSIKGA